MVGMDHLHAPLVSIREQAAHVVAMLRGGEPVTFRALIAGAEVRGVIVARFLAVLELYRHAAISFEQVEPLGELTLRWTAGHWTDDSSPTWGPTMSDTTATTETTETDEPRDAGGAGRPSTGRRRRARARGDPHGRRRAAERRSLATVLGVPVPAVRQSIERLVADYDGDRRLDPARVRAARGRRRLAPLRAPRARRRGARVRAHPEPDQALAGGARDARR